MPPDRHIHRVLFDRPSGNRALVVTGFIQDALDEARLGRIVAGVQPDVLYVWGATGLSIRALASVSRRIPMVVYVADYWLADWLSGDRSPDGFTHQVEALASRPLVRAEPANRLINRAFSMAARRMYPARVAVSPVAVEFDSRHMADDVKRRGITLANARVLPHAIELRRFQYLRPEDRQAAPRVLFAGRVVPQKGVETLLRAIPELRQTVPEVTLTIAGPVEPQYARALYELGVSLDVSECVTVTGRRSHDEMVQLYETHTVLAFPSEWDEPFGIVLVEAMASGLPIVSSGAGGSREIVTDGVNGLVFERGDASDLAKKLSALLSSATLRSRLAHQARADAEAKYDIEVMVDQVERDLIDAAAGGGP